jgi:hypothetical protein
MEIRRVHCRRAEGIASYKAALIPLRLFIGRMHRTMNFERSKDQRRQSYWEILLTRVIGKYKRMHHVV